MYTLYTSNILTHVFVGAIRWYSFAYGAIRPRFRRLTVHRPPNCNLQRVRNKLLHCTVMLCVSSAFVLHDTVATNSAVRTALPTRSAALPLQFVKPSSRQLQVRKYAERLPASCHQQ